MAELLNPRSCRLGLLCAIVVYLSLVLPAVPAHGIGNDELIDMKIASAYVDSPWGWLRGVDLDATQTRLPMYVTAAAARLAGTESLMLSRLISVLCGVLTLVGVYWFCARELDAFKGVVAAFLLAISPYYLAFTKTAMTETDALVGLGGIALALATATLGRRPTVGTACLAALAGGVAVSLKFTTAAWLPAAFVAFLFLRGRRSHPPPPAPVYVLVVLMAAGIAAVVAGWWYLSPQDIYFVDRPYRHQSPSYLVRHITWVAAAWGACALTGWYWRHQAIGRFAAAWIAGLGAVLTFFLFPPVHTTNPGIVQELARVLMADDGLPVGMQYSALVLHLLVVLLKSGPAMGLLFVGSTFAALWFAGRRPVLLLPLLFIAFYFALLVLTGRAQTFYMLGLMPFFAILAADMLSEVLRRSRYAAAAILAVVSLNAAADLARSYPDMHLNGYQWVGERYIAYRSTVGYKSLVMTPSDGTTQVIDWALDNIKPGEPVVAYLRGRLLAEYLAPRSAPFRVTNGFSGRGGLDKANYVLLHINATLRQFESSRRPLAIEGRSHTTARATLDRPTPGSIYLYPFDREQLERQFTKVFSVKRAFGIEVASVWRRKRPLQTQGSGDTDEM